MAELTTKRECEKEEEEEEEEDQSAELQDYCKQVFRICDRDGNGFISREEVARFCSESGSDSLLDSIMSKLDTDHDGKITFDEFQAGFKAYGETLIESGDPNVSHVTSTPGAVGAGRTGFLSDEEVYESDPSLIDDEGGWLEAMERLDPDGLLKGTDIERLWGRLARKDPSLLDNFENFLSEVIEELKQSALDQASLETHVRRVMDQHSKEVNEMEQLLEEQLSEVKADQRLMSASKTQRLSSHFARLLSDREAMIARLADQESTLKRALQDKATAELRLKEERGRLLQANEGLKMQLNRSVEQLTVSRKAVARLTSHNHQDGPPPPASSCSPPSSPPSEEAWPRRSQSAEGTAGMRLVADEEGAGESSLVRYFPPKKSPVHKASSLDNFPNSYTTLEGSDIAMDTKPNQSYVARQLFTPDSSGGKLSSTSSRSQSRSPLESHDSHMTKEKPLYDTSKAPPPPNPNSHPATSSHDDHMTPKSHDDHVTPKDREGDPFLREQEVPAVGRVTPANDISLTFSGWMPRRRDLPRPSSPTAVNRVFKVVFIGNSGVGKTSLILRLGEGQFSLSHGSTLGLDFTTKTLRIGNERVVFQLWDTAGQERFHSALTPVYFRRADAFVIVYDVTDRASFKNTKSWLSVISAALREHPPVVMLVGNKCDRTSSREVSLEEGRTLALELHAMFSEMSALSGDNVLQAHTTLAQLLLARENEELATARRTLLELNNQPQRKKWCAC